MPTRLLVVLNDAELRPWRLRSASIDWNNAARSNPAAVTDGGHPLVVIGVWVRALRVAIAGSIGESQDTQVRVTSASARI